MDIIFSIIPILALILLLGVFRVSGYVGSLFALLVCVIIAVLYFHFPMYDFWQSVLYGSLKAFGLIILIVIMAIFGYNILLHTQYMQILQTQIASISTDKTIQVLLITFGFGGLLESLAGFGTSVAIPMAILIGLGYAPLMSAIVSLIANSAITAFASIGLVISTLSHETDISQNLLGKTILWQLLPLMILTIFMVVMIVDKKALWKNIFLSIGLGLIFFLSQYMALLFWGVALTGIISTNCVLLALIMIAKFFYHSPVNIASFLKKEHLKAWSIYIIIVGLILITTTLKNFLDPLWHNRFEFVIASKQAMFEISWLTAIPFLLFIGSIIGGLIQGASIKTLSIVFVKTSWQMSKTSFTILCLVIFASIMDFSGMLQNVALFGAQITQHYFAFIAPMIGCMGTFLTGSNVASNILFAKLQYAVAHHLHFDTTWISSANTSGATVGKMISPQSIFIATATCHIEGQERKILKSVIVYVLICLLVLSVVVYLFS